MKYEDSRQAWVVAASGCLLLMVTMGMNRISGLLFVSLMEKEDLSRGVASWPFNLPGAAVIVMSPVAAVLSTRFSPSCLTLVGTLIFVLGHIPCYFSTNIVVVSVFYGLVKGCGFGLVAVLVPLLTGASFKRHRATAMGISTCGQAIGGIFLPPLVQFFLLKYELNGTFLLLGAISAHALLASLGYKWYHQKTAKPGKAAPKTEDERSPLLKSTEGPSDYGSKNYASKALDNVEQREDVGKTGEIKDSEVRGPPEKENQKPASKGTEKGEGTSKKKMNWRTLRGLFTNRSFYIVCANQMLNVFVGQVLTQVVIDYLADKGIEVDLALYLLTINSVGEIAGRVCLGWIPDKKLLSNENHVALFLTLSAGMLVLITHSLSFPVLMVASFLLGASQGTALTMNFVHFADRMSRDEMALAISLTRSVNGVGALIRAPVIGFFRDTLGSYDQLFYLCSAIILATALSWLIEGCFASRQLKKKKKSSL